MKKLNRAQPNFHMKSENPSVSLSNVDCSLYTRRVMPKEDYHKMKISRLAYTPVEYNYMETLAKTYILPARQNQFIKENIFSNALIRPIPIATKSNSAFTGSSAENPFCYHKFNLRDIGISRGGQPFVHHATTDNCRLCVTTMTAMNFQDDILSIRVDNFKDHYVLVFHLTSMQDPAEHCHHWVSVHWIVSLTLCSKTSKWHVCDYQHITKQHASGSLENQCRVLSWIVFRRFSWSIHQQLSFSRAKLQPSGSDKTTRSSQCMQLLHNLCSISFVQVSTRGDNWRSWCQCALFYKKFYVIDYQFTVIVQLIQCTCSNLYFLINILKSNHNPFT